MKVYYRITSIPSTNPPPTLVDNKDALNELCLKSFVTAFKEVNPSMVFIADYCSPRTRAVIEEVCPFEKETLSTSMGINGTALQQYFLANSQDNDLLFCECDYLWRENTGSILLDGLNKLGLVVPYDNLNFYLDPLIHSDNVKIRLINGQHWRSVERTTMTFAIKNNVFKENYVTFREYGYLDNQVWHDLRDAGHQMWSPLPSLATHMVRDFMAPGIDWSKYYGG